MKKGITHKLKRAMAFLLVLIMCTALAGGFSVGAEEEKPSATRNVSEDSALIGALESFFEKREADFSMKRQNEPSDSAHVAYLQAWLDSFSFTVTSSDVSYRIEELLEEKADSFKVKVYEWVYLYYYWTDAEGVHDDVMGFGTPHVIEVDKQNYTILDDSYMEITGYDHYLQENYDYIRIPEETDEEIIFEACVEEPNMRANSSYSPAAAVAYSNTWCGQPIQGAQSSDPNPQNTSSYNPHYYYYDQDCCNFVSQCLHEGNIAMSGTWSTTKLPNQITPIQDTAYQYSSNAWINTQGFNNYFLSAGYTRVTVTSLSKCTAGNPIFWLASDGYATNHNMLIVGKTSTAVLVNAHNGDAYRYPYSLSSHISYTFCMKHNETVSQYDANFHKYICTTCGSERFSAHKWKTVGIVRRCSVCGYSEGGTQSTPHEEE